MMSSIALASYFGWVHSWWHIINLLILAASKIWAGYGWILLKPNKYTILDFLLLKPGRKTPERMSLEARDSFNLGQGFFDREEPSTRQGVFFGLDIGRLVRRRRLAEKPNPIGTQLMNLFFILAH